MFESHIYNKKENKNVALSPSFDAPGQKIIFWIYLMYMEILVFTFEGPISNSKLKKCPPSPLYAPGNIFCFKNFFDLYGNFSI